MTVTFKLREGVQFHSNDQFTPTRDLNADDVIFSFDRQGNPENPYNAVSGGTCEYLRAACRCPTSSRASRRSTTTRSAST